MGKKAAEKTAAAVGEPQNQNPWRQVQCGMANLSLVYGLRLLPEGELDEVGSGKIKLKNGREEHVTLHLLEGSKEEIEAQLKQSIEAFFDIYPEIQ